MLKLLTPRDVARALGVSETWVYRNKEAIGFLRIGPRLVRFTEAAVLAYQERMAA